MKRYRSVHQFHSGTAYGDAITNQMVVLRGVLRELGYTSHIFANHVAPEYVDDFKSAADLTPDIDSLLIFHHSMGSDWFEQVLALPHDIVTLYHNVTPEHFFNDEDTRRYARLGRDQLSVLARRSAIGVAASNYNRTEMVNVGFRRVEVLPVRTQFDRAPAATDRHGFDWLFVGRVVENKRQLELVRAFAHYVHNYHASARLLLVGDLSRRSYVDRVRQEARHFAVADRVILTGKLTDAELRGVMLQTGVYISMSEHEGFGVPLLEAMAASVPVIAHDAGAVAETMGGAGILVRGSAPERFAATAELLRRDPELRASVVEQQHRRIDRLGQVDVRADLERIIAMAAGELLPPWRLQVQGPFETSYSLATLNRSLALGLAQYPPFEVSLYATEGPGDYVPEDDDLAVHPEAAALYEKGKDCEYPDIVIRQMWPPRLYDSPAGYTFSYFGWEESRLPQEMVDNFNRHATAIGVMSSFVEHVLADCGVKVPICTVGVGIDPHDPAARSGAPELEGLRSFRFLNIGSAFPRKGLDVLIDAYFAEFTGDDEVSLILKTFPNEHNRVGEQLAAARANAPNPPDVRWIDRDFSAAELRALYNYASCYVHPARGEGFGMPVAEAMLANVPVITLEYSGLADFVSDRTALTVGFRLAPAASHVSVEGSLWAEPDLGDLRRAMRDMVRGIDVSGRVKAARSLIEREFTWEAVSARWARFVEATIPAVHPAHIAMITTWNSKCGIAEYSKFFIESGEALFQAELYANRDAEALDPRNESEVTRCWTHRWNPDLTDLRAALQSSTADLTHVQFNFGFFDIAELGKLLDAEAQHRPTVVTFHRTEDIIEDDGNVLTLSAITPHLDRAGALVVHQQADVDRLAAMGLERNVVLIPHGTPPPPAADSVQARAALQLGDRPIVATFGFLLPHKGTLALIDSIDRLRFRFPDIALVALCASYPISVSYDYEATVRKHIETRGLHDNVLLLTDFLAAETARVILAAANVIALPYETTAESASGAMRFVLSVGRPVVATDLPIFDDAKDSFVAVPPNTPAALDEMIAKLIADEPLAQVWATRAAKFSRQTDWTRVARDHAQLYARLRAEFHSRSDTHRPRSATSRVMPA